MSDNDSRANLPSCGTAGWGRGEPACNSTVLCRKELGGSQLLSHERSGPIHKCESITCFVVFLFLSPLERGTVAEGNHTRSDPAQSLTGALSGRQRYRGSYHKPSGRAWRGGGQWVIEHAAQRTAWLFCSVWPRVRSLDHFCVQAKHRLRRIAGRDRALCYDVINRKTNNPKRQDRQAGRQSPSQHSMM